jgi:hypothetical protein
MNDLQYYQECGCAYHWVSMSNKSNSAGEGQIKYPTRHGSYMKSRSSMHTPYQVG